MKNDINKVAQTTMNNDYKIEVLNENSQFTPIKVGLTLEEAWYWWGRIWDLGETAVITHPDNEPF